MLVVWRRGRLGDTPPYREPEPGREPTLVEQTEDALLIATPLLSSLLSLSLSLSFLLLPPPSPFHYYYTHLTGRSHTENLFDK